MKKIIFLLLICTSCTSIKFSTLSVEESNNQKLPTLKLKIDEYSLLNAYSISQTSGSYSNSESNRTYSETTTFDPRIQDTKTLLERETFTNICDELGKTYGSIEYKISNINKKKNVTGLALSSCALYLPSLLGITQVSFKIEIEITTKIFNQNNYLIAKYTSSGFGNEKAKLYGYSFDDANRIANIQAIKNALYKNREKILSDFDDISKQLVIKQ